MVFMLLVMMLVESRKVVRGKSGLGLESAFLLHAPPKGKPFFRCQRLKVGFEVRMDVEIRFVR
jgi:hypothetical protein